MKVCGLLQILIPTGARIVLPVIQLRQESITQTPFPVMLSAPARLVAEIRFDLTMVSMA